MEGPTAPSEVAPPDTVWARLPVSRRRFVVLAAIAGFLLLALGTAWFAVLVLGGAAATDGIAFLPLGLAELAYAALIGASVLLVLRAAGSDPEVRSLARLGTLWALASIPLNFDYLLDSFPPKLAISALFVVVAVRYWKGDRNGYLSLLLAPLTAIIALADGLGHIAGNFCTASAALDACPAKAVSDLYLVMLLVGVIGVTLVGRTQRPDPKRLVLYVLVIVLLGAGFLLLPF